MVFPEGLEPSCLTARDFKSPVYPYSTTGSKFEIGNILYFTELFAGSGSGFAV